MCKDELWIKLQATPLHHWDQNTEAKDPASDLGRCLPACCPSAKYTIPRCCLPPGSSQSPPPWMGQLPGKHPWNTSKKTDYRVFTEFLHFFFTCPAYSFSSVNRLGTRLWKIPHMLSQTPLHLATLTPTELKSRRSFPIPPKKRILEQTYLTLYFMKGRNKYVKPLAAKWTVHPLGKQVTPCFAWGFEVSPSILHEYTEAMKLFVKKKHSSTQFPVTSTQPHGKITATPVSTAFKGRLILFLFFPDILQINTKVLQQPVILKQFPVSGNKVPSDWID